MCGERCGVRGVEMRRGWMITEEVGRVFKALPPPDTPHLNDYVGVSDLVEAVRLLLDYDPTDGFEAFLFSAEDQRSTVPSLELAKNNFPGARVDEAKLGACGGFGALVDCTRARERLGWTATSRGRR